MIYADISGRLGADAVIIARPYVNAVFGDGEQGVKILTESLGQELENTMMMCGVSSLKEINKDVDNNIFGSLSNVNLNCIIGYNLDGKKHTFLDDYE